MLIVVYIHVLHNFYMLYMISVAFWLTRALILEKQTSGVLLLIKHFNQNETSSLFKCFIFIEKCS